LSGEVTLMFAGQVTAGGWVSLTVTVNEQLAVLVPSLAEQLTVVVPFGKAEPAGGLQVAGIVVGGQLSVADGVV
jgi:hypothetical protein